MIKTLKTFLFLASISAIALGVFSQSSLSGGIASVQTAHADNHPGNSCGAPSTLPSVTVSSINTVVGETITYLIVGSNTPSATTTMEVTYQLAAGLTFDSATASSGTYSSSTGIWDVGTITYGSSIPELAILATVDASAAGQTIQNSATVSYSETGGCTDTDSIPPTPITVQALATPTTTPQSADLSISKTADVTSTVEGGVVNYALTVLNNSTSTTSTDVVANDVLPSGLTFENATASVGTYVNTTGVWTIGDLLPNANATLDIAALTNATGTITNTATVGESASTTDPDLSNNSSSVSVFVTPVVSTSTPTSTPSSPVCTSGCGGGGSAQANLSIVKTVDNNNPATGATIHYTLTVSAGGPSNSTNVVADDVLPAGVTFVSATSSEGSYVNSTGVWTIGTMPAGSTATLTITATVNATAGTTVANTGTVSETAGLINSLSGSDASTATLTVAGGGGTVTPGGGTSTSTTGLVLGASTSTIGGSVLGASTSTGQVLGASCGLYLTSYIHPDRKYLNDPAQVEKLQVFLNQNLGLNLPIDGVYGTSTIAAVNAFQVKYHSEILSPWVSLGLPTQFTTTGYVYQTTERWINLIMCPSLNIPLPSLKVDAGA